MSFLERNRMRKSILASLCLVLSICVGCGSQVKTETNPTGTDLPPKVAEEQPAETAATEATNKPIYVEPKTYEEVLDAIYDFASAAPEDRYTAGRTNMRGKINITGVHEVVYGDTPEERLSKIGYCIEDISGDGIPELIIGTINNKSEYKGTRIISLYTTVDGKAYLARGEHIRIDGWSRCRYYLLDNGMLYNEGSGGAANVSRSVSCLSEDGKFVKKLESLSTFSLKSEAIRSGNGQKSSDGLGSHHRIYDENGNCTLEELDDPETRWQLQRMRESYRSRAVEMDLIPMLEYK